MSEKTTESCSAVGCENRIEFVIREIDNPEVDPGEECYSCSSHLLDLLGSISPSTSKWRWVVELYEQ